MPIAEISEQGRIWFQTSGEGRPLLQIHGSAFGHRNFERLTPLLAGSCQVVDFDLPGFGESVPTAGLSIHELADDVARLIPALGHERVDVHGTSFGGLVGLSLAARHPELMDRVVLSCFLPRYDRAAFHMRETWKRAALESGMDAVADLTAVAGFSRSFYEDEARAEAQLASTREAFRHGRPETFVAATSAAQQLDFSGLGARVTAPTLLLAGAEDAMTPVSPGASGFGFDRLVETLPDGRLVVLDDCGHYLVLEQPERVAAEIRAFLGQGPPND